MTYNYSATLWTCWQDFLKNAKIDGSDYEEVVEDFKLFYNYLRVCFEENMFFKNSSKVLLNFLKKELQNNKQLKITTSDKSNTYLEYNKSIFVRLDKRYKSVRFTMSFQQLTQDLDLKKIYQSLRPNLIHSLDATYVRLILNHLPYGIITIHDSFGIDILSVNILIKIANYSINNLNNLTPFSEMEAARQFASKFILL